jgi:hypothetical protein
MSKKRITTLEELARLSQDEFLGVNRRLDRLEEKIDAGFERMGEKMDAGFKSIVELIRMEREDRKRNHAAHGVRIKRIEEKLSIE